MEKGEEVKPNSPPLPSSNKTDKNRESCLAGKKIKIASLR
jgi:hypothetical protein